MNDLFYLRGTKISKIAAISTACLGAIAGFYCGNAFAIQTTFYTYSENKYVFNTPLALTIWLATALVVVSLVLCYCHFQNQEEVNYQLDKLTANLANIEKNTRKED